MRTCLVLGAGMSGLTAARRLQENGWHVIVIDKGRGVGGRLATRRIDEAVFDHGAQFITARDPAFESLIADLQSAGVVYEWCRGIPVADQPPHPDGHPRYQGTGGMAEIAKHLAKGLDVRIRHKAVQIKIVDDKWLVHVDTAPPISADALVCTAPVPQTLDLLDLGGCELPENSRQQLDRIKYHPCLALMVLVEGPSGLPDPGALRLTDGAVSFICDNHMKGISPEATGITVHASPAFSREHWNVNEADVRHWLLKRASEYFSSPVRSATLHRWRFSMPSEPHPARFLRVPTAAPLLFAGDAFDGPRVEGAALSGMAAAEDLLGSTV